MREGVSRDGSHLFPAFPYYAFTKLSDDDIEALYAYFMTRPPVERHRAGKHTSVPSEASAPSRKVGRFCFSEADGTEPIPSKSDEWNRGAYLAEASCGLLQAVIRRAILSVPKRHATLTPAPWSTGGLRLRLTAANPSPIPWTEEELFTYLRTGASPLHGATAGTMTPVIRGSLALPIVPDSDVRAIAVYFTDMDHASERASDHRSEYT